MFPIVVQSAWACLGVLGRAWVCLGMLGRAWACMGGLGRDFVYLCFICLGSSISSYI